MSDRTALMLALDKIPERLDRLDAVMATGRWYTKPRLAQLVGCREHAISARLSDLRTQRGQTIVKKYVGEGVWLYRRALDQEARAA